jgi:hypothetical protein
VLKLGSYWRQAISMPIFQSAAPMPATRGVRRLRHASAGPRLPASTFRNRDLSDQDIIEIDAKLMAPWR